MNYPKLPVPPIGDPSLLMVHSTIHNTDLLHLYLIIYSNNWWPKNEPSMLLLVHSNKLLNFTITIVICKYQQQKVAVIWARQGYYRKKLLWMCNPYILWIKMFLYFVKICSQPGDKGMKWHIETKNKVLHYFTSTSRNTSKIIYTHLKPRNISSSSSFKCKHR